MMKERGMDQTTETPASGHISARSSGGGRFRLVLHVVVAALATASLVISSIVSWHEFDSRHLTASELHGIANRATYSLIAIPEATFKNETGGVEEGQIIGYYQTAVRAALIQAASEQSDPAPYLLLSNIKRGAAPPDHPAMPLIQAFSYALYTDGKDQADGPAVCLTLTITSSSASVRNGSCPTS